MSHLITEVSKIENLLKTSAVKTITMYRMNFDGKRAYVTTEPFNVYSGLTGALSAATFKGNIESKRIGKWRDKMIASLGGQEAQEGYLQTLADFGTLTHSALVTIKNEGKLDWALEQDQAYAYFENSAKENGIIPNTGVIRSQVFDYCKAIAAILQFCYDNVTEIYAIESMCKSDELMIATPIDFCASIKTKEGDVKMSVNLKTSSQIGNHHREQVSVEKYLWNQTYPDFQMDKTAVLRNKDWSLKKGIPTYEFEVLDKETENKFLTNALDRLRICKADQNSTYYNFKSEVQLFTGITKLGEAPKIETKTLEALFKESQNTDQLSLANTNENN